MRTYLAVVGKFEWYDVQNAIIQAESEEEAASILVNEVLGIMKLHPGDRSPWQDKVSPFTLRDITDERVILTYGQDG